MIGTRRLLVGTPDNDEILLGYGSPGTQGDGFSGGDDAVFASAGSDVLDAWSGNDMYAAGDTIRVQLFHTGGEPGAFPVMVFKFDQAGLFLGWDLLANFEAYVGSTMDDQISLGPGDDTLDGGAGADMLDGGAGRDTLVFLGETRMGVEVRLDFGYVRDAWGDYDQVAGIEDVVGTAWTDVIIGDAGDNVLSGGDGDDTLVGGYGADTLIGGGGADFLVNSAGDDTLAGGAGNDAYSVASAGTVIVEEADGGLDTAWYTVSGATTAPYVEASALAGDATLLYGSFVGETLYANAALGSTLHGQGGDDILVGSPFRDTLMGGAGNDLLQGKGGGDVLAGGAGDDTYIVADAGDRIVERPDEGSDVAVFLTDSDWRLDAHVETGLLGDGARRLSGADTGQMLVNFSVQGATLAGGAGNDTLWGAAGLRDTLMGGAGNDTLLGQGGGDVLMGGAGDDISVVVSLDDTVVEAAGEGNDIVLVAVDGWVARAANVEFFMLTAGARHLRADDGGRLLVANGALGSTLEGGAGDDILLGSALDDVLAGGAGDDQIIMGGGADRLVLGAAWGNDQVLGFTPGCVVDLRGSGLARGQVSVTAIPDGARLESGAGSVNLWGMTVAQAQDALLF